MPYTVTLDESGPWLVIDYAGVVEGSQLVASRVEAATLNADAAVRDFILDFTEVTEFVLSTVSVEEIHAVDRERKEKLPAGRCALVAPRELVEIGATFLAAVSPLKLDFRAFGSRARAEAWLRGTLAEPPPPLPRRR
jgi:hypothetical protein